MTKPNDPLAGVELARAEAWADKPRRYVNAFAGAFNESTDDIARWFKPHEVEVAPGVVAVVTTDPHDGGLGIPWVRSTQPGHGHVGAWIDALPTDVPVRFIGVVSERLDGMLERRSFKRCLVPMPAMSGFVPSRVRRPIAGTPVIVDPTFPPLRPGPVTQEILDGVA